MPLTTEERRAEIMMEETVSTRPRTPDRDDEEREYRAGVRGSIKRILAAGWEVIIPNELPEQND